MHLRGLATLVGRPNSGVGSPAQISNRRCPLGNFNLASSCERLQFKRWGWDEVLLGWPARPVACVIQRVLHLIRQRYVRCLRHPHVCLANLQLVLYDAQPIFGVRRIY